MPMVKELRQAKGWTQEDLAREAGLTHATVGNIERGKSVSRTTRRLIAQALGVKPEEIVWPERQKQSA